MRFRKRQRLVLVLAALLLLGGATGLVLAALDDSLAFFVSPADIAKGEVTKDRRLRLGGLVVAGSVKHGDDGEVRFRLTDRSAEIPVVYAGLLPDLFREGQGIVAQGRLGPDGTFRADEVLAKHDETYMPREVVDSLKDADRWQEGARRSGP